jgi:hypothetical protein
MTFGFLEYLITRSQMVGFLDAEDKDDGFLFGVGGCLPKHKALQPEMLCSSTCVDCLLSILYKISNLQRVSF